MSLRGQSKTENWYIALSARPAAVIVINNFGRRDNGGDLQERSERYYITITWNITKLFDVVFESREWG